MGLALLISFSIMIITYIVKFNADFKKESLEKVLPFLIGLSIIIIILIVLNNL